MNLHITTEKTELIGQVVGTIKSSNLKNVHFEKNPKVEKHNNFTFHD